jgi:hypothetical protein
VSRLKLWKYADNKSRDLVFAKRSGSSSSSLIRSCSITLVCLRWSLMRGASAPPSSHRRNRGTHTTGLLVGAGIGLSVLAGALAGLVPLAVLATRPSSISPEVTKVFE